MPETDDTGTKQKSMLAVAGAVAGALVVVGLIVYAVMRLLASGPGPDTPVVVVGGSIDADTYQDWSKTSDAMYSTPVTLPGVTQILIQDQSGTTQQTIPTQGATWEVDLANIDPDAASEQDKQKDPKAVVITGNAANMFITVDAGTKGDWTLKKKRLTYHGKSPKCTPKDCDTLNSVIVKVGDTPNGPYPCYSKVKDPPDGLCQVVFSTK